MLKKIEIGDRSLAQSNGCLFLIPSELELDFDIYKDRMRQSATCAFCLYSRCDRSYVVDVDMSNDIGKEFDHMFDQYKIGEFQNA